VVVVSATVVVVVVSAALVVVAAVVDEDAPSSLPHAAVTRASARSIANTETMRLLSID
jgi:hypothetical protein